MNEFSMEQDVTWNPKKYSLLDLMKTTLSKPQQEFIFVLE